MLIFKIFLIAVVTTVITLIMKSFNQTFVPVVSISAGIVILFLVIPFIHEILYLIRDVYSVSGKTSYYLKIIFKIVSISVLGEFSSRICEDGGNFYFSSKINFAVKILIIYQILPVLNEFIQSLIITVEEL